MRFDTVHLYSKTGKVWPGMAGVWSPVRYRSNPRLWHIVEAAPLCFGLATQNDSTHNARSRGRTRHRSRQEQWQLWTRKFPLFRAARFPTKVHFLGPRDPPQKFHQRRNENQTSLAFLHASPTFLLTDSSVFTVSRRLERARFPVRNMLLVTR